MVGKKFGRLTVFEKAYRKGTGTYYKCLCDCGNERIVHGGNLSSGRTKSCGCLNKELMSNSVPDIIGRRFGKLTVLAKTDTRKGTNVVYSCRCDCGNICEVTNHALGRNVNSCGCLKVDMLNEDVVEGTRLRCLTSKKRERIKPDSGVKGVAWNRGGWLAYIGFRGEKHTLGWFPNTPEGLANAIKARKEAEDKYFKPILKKYDKDNKGRPDTEERMQKSAEIDGNTKSCGCLQRDTGRENGLNLTDKVDGIAKQSPLG